MKKTALVLLVLTAILASVFAFTACSSSGSTVDQSWSSQESMTFSITKNSEAIGTANFTLITDPYLTDEDYSIEPDANTKLVSTVAIGNTVTTTVFYAHVYTVLQYAKTYVDADHPENNYVLKGEHKGKYLEYDLTYENDASKNKSGKLKVGSSGYTDGEFLYLYIRCYDIGDLSTKVKVANPMTNEVVELTCGLKRQDAAVKTETSLHTVTCNEISIVRASTPVGSGISAYYLPDKSEYSYGSDMISSKKFPVQIVENDITYTLTDFSPKQ